MSFTANHATALAKVTDKGAAVTFTKVTRGSYSAADDTFTSTTSTVTGYAVRIPGNPNRYAALGLTESKAPTLLFTASTYGDTPEVGSTCSWGGETFTVRDVEPLAPDGTTILSTVVVAE